MVLPPNMQPPMMGGPAPVPQGPPMGMPGMPPAGAPPMSGPPGMMQPPMPPMDPLQQAMMNIDPMYPGSPMTEEMGLQLAMQDQQTFLALIRLMSGEADNDGKPKKPHWYRQEDYAMPSAASITGFAQIEKSRYSLLVARMRKDRLRIRAESVGVFQDHKEDDATWVDPSLALDYMLMVSLLSSCDILHTKKPYRIGDQKRAEMIEEFCYALRERTEREHTQKHGTVLIQDEVKTALSTGHLVARVYPDYESGSDEVPIMVDMLDPASCFAGESDRHGLRTMTRLFMASCKSLIAEFGLDKKQRKQLMSKKTKNTDGSERDRLEADVVEVTEYWDRRWFAIAVDGDVLVGPSEHGLFRVPFVYKRSGTGDPGQVSLHNLNGSNLVGSLYSEQEDLANKGQSYIQYLQKAHEQREAVMGIVAGELMKVKDPPRTFEQAPTVYGDAPAIGNNAGDISMLRAGEEAEVPNNPDGRLSLLGPMMTNVTEAAQRGLLPPAMYGQMPTSQGSGTVLEGMGEYGRDKMDHWKRMLQEFYREVDELALVFMRDHGRKLGDEGSRGEPLMIERQHQSPDEDGYIEFDYRVLKDDPCRVKVEMSSLRQQALGPVGNAVMQWKNLGLMTNEDALKLRGVRNPAAYMKQVQIEDFQNTPEFKKSQLIKWMKDQEMWEELPTVLYLMATGGGGGGQQSPGGGAMPGNAPPPMAGMPGAAGQQGGAPMGPMRLPGPPPGMNGIPG